MHFADSLIGRLQRYAANSPNRIALISADEKLTYAELARAVTLQAARLEEKGVTEQACVGIHCADDLGHLLLCLAATQIGASSCTLSSRDSADARAALGERCLVTHVLEADCLLPLNDRRPVSTAVAVPSVPPTSKARLLFSTSGTTGRPKIVVHQDEGLVAQAHRHVESHAERFACIASIENNFAKRHRLYALAMGATNVFLSRDSAELVDQCLSLKVSVLHVSGYQAQELLSLPGIEQLALLRLKLGGAHVSLRLRDQLRRGITTTLQAGYGTTETGAIGFTDPLDDDAGESVGKPLPGIFVRVVDAQREPLSNGHLGEIAIRCEGMFAGYLNASEQTNRRLESGWFYTGDIGRLDSQGRIHLSGRADDMFVFNSMNIYPQDLETVLMDHPDIADAAVIPRESSVHGHIPVALVVFRPGVKQRLRGIEKFARKRLGERRPRQYLLVNEIPKTAAGKTARNLALELSGRGDDIRQDILNLLEDQAIEQLSAADLAGFRQGHRDIMFNQLSLDSLSRMGMLVGLELAYDVIITPKQLGGFRSLNQIVAHILSGVESLPGEYQPNSPVTDGLVDEPDSFPRIVKLLRRVFRYCDSVAQLHKAIETLEVRLTPTDVSVLDRYHQRGHLVPQSAAQKYHAAMSDWLEDLGSAMSRSSAHQLERFRYRRVGQGVNLFTGTGSPGEKSLLICFPPRDSRHLGIPNPVWLQHIAAQHFDVLIVTGLFATGYSRGRSQFAQTQEAFHSWWRRQPWVGEYRALRTLGFSAGARMAISVAHQLGAERALCVSGRFHRKRFILKNLDQMYMLWRSARRSSDGQVKLSYSSNNARDRFFARCIGGLVRAGKIEVHHQALHLRHLFLPQLLDSGDLGAFLAASLFATESDVAVRNSDVEHIHF